MKHEKIIIVGAGPCGMSTALELQKLGFDPLIIEKGCIVNSIYHYPTHQTFFSSSEKLEIGQVPFISEKQKPVRNEALTYYRAVAERQNLRINSFEKVERVTVENNQFYLYTTNKNGSEEIYKTAYVIMATGYYDQPNLLGIPGEELPKVSHYFKEAHPYFKKNVVVIGGKNSAVDASLELVKAGAFVTVLYRGEQYSKSIKPWILPLFDSLVKKEIVNMEFKANIKKITEEKVEYIVDGIEKSIPNDFVFAMTGYHPDHQLLKNLHIHIQSDNGRPHFDENTMESNVPNIYIAGVIAAGYNNNEVFIENGRFHGEKIARSIEEKENAN